MKYRVYLPETIVGEIRSWGLSRSVLLQLLSRLHGELAERHLDICYRLAAPSPTFVYNRTIPDDQNPQLEHWFTFHFTYGEKDGVLYARQCFHDAEDSEAE